MSSKEGRTEKKENLSKKFIKAEGTVEELLPSAKFKVKLDSGKTIRAHLSGKMRMYRIKILPGDRVKLEISPYDLTKGRIVYRL
ncbi:MAG TPA: translation initiation factor IF-1 [Patescibacteria group bacterium]|nr:translation initiation factor IF-1 [Patescibacteria group bacterium]